MLIESLINIIVTSLNQITLITSRGYLAWIFLKNDLFFLLMGVGIFWRDTMSTWDYITVTKKQWQDLIKIVEDKELQMFVIRSWANAQTVSLASILAFKGEIQTSYKDREAAKNILGPITVALRKVTTPT